MVTTKKIFSGIAGLLVTALLQFSPVHAKAMTSEECGVLREQRQKLESAGLGDKLDKGAKWAAENLDAGQISEIGTFLKLMENIRFRCGKVKSDSKSKFGLQVNVPLPVRNSRRMAKNTRTRKSDASMPASDKKMANETRAVLSAVTKNGDGAQAAGDKTKAQPSKTAQPEARKSFGK